MMRALGMGLLLGVLAVAWADEDIRARLAATKAQLAQALAEMQRLDRQLARAREALLEAERELAHARTVREQAEAARRRAQARLKKERQALLDALVGFWVRRDEGPIWLGSDVSEAAHRRMLLREVLAWQADAVARWRRAYEDARRAQERAQAAEKRWREARAGRARAMQRLMGERRHKRNWIARLVRRRRALEEALRAQEAALASAMLAPEERALGGQEKPHPGTFRWPVRGRVRVRFGQPAPPLGRPADGILITPEGDLVRAAAAGRVRYAGWFGGLGLLVLLDHGHGIWTMYAHNEALLVHAGDWVEAGEPIARAGATGWVEEPTLYFGLREHGRARDPLVWLARKPSRRGGG